MAILKVSVEDTCTACQLCVDTAPDIFEMGEDIVQVIKGSDFNAHEEAIREAAEDCPVGAIKVD